MLGCLGRPETETVVMLAGQDDTFHSSIFQSYAANAYNTHAEYGSTAEDVRNNINGTMVYALPVGRGQMFGSHMGNLMNKAVGGWKVSGTGVVYSGFPLAILANVNNAYTNNKSQRADHDRPLDIVNRSYNSWFGTDPSVATAYTQPVAGTYGKCGGRIRTFAGFPAIRFLALQGFRDCGGAVDWLSSGCLQCVQYNEPW
jgi:hypothetical protein